MVGQAGSDVPVVSGRPVSSSDERDVSLMLLAEWVLRHRRALVLTGLAFALAAGVLTLVRGPRYISTASFFASDQGSTMSNLEGIAAQFGIAIPGQQQGGSVDFYAKLVSSTDVLAQAATTTYHVRSEGDSIDGTYIQLVQIGGNSPHRVLLNAIETLRSNMTVSSDLKSGIVTVKVKAPWPDLAESLNVAILSLVNDFNMRAKQQRARDEYHFAQARLGPLRADLDSAESALARFQTANRGLDNSPRLQLELARLTRRAELAQQTYLAVMQTYESAGIEQYRNTPVITVVDSPAGSAVRKRGLLVNTIVGLVLGMCAAVGWLLCRSYLRREQELDPDTSRAVLGHLRRLPGFGVISRWRDGPRRTAEPVPEKRN